MKGMHQASDQRRHFPLKQVCAAVASLFAEAALAQLPSGWTVTAGSATVGLRSDTEMIVEQRSPRVIIDWRSFNIDRRASVTYEQPGPTAVAVNRVGADAGQSIIDGMLNANGLVMILNPNGVLFGRTASVNVGGLVASTGAIDDAAFMRGDGRLLLGSGTTGAGIVNRGTITVAEGGLVALIAPSAANSGLIEARLGRVVLAGASKVTLDLYGDNLVQIAVDGGSRAAGVLVANSGVITADGGRVLLAAEAARGVLDEVINLSGVVQARGIGMVGGTVVLDGGDGGTVAVSGRIDTANLQQEGKGGTIKVLGADIDLRDSAALAASGAGGGGTILVGGGWQGKGPERNARSTRVAAGATLAADAATAGDGGTVVVWADGSNDFSGAASARGGPRSGNGGRVEVSGKQGLGFSGLVDTSAANGKTGYLLLDPAYLVVGTGTDANDGTTRTVNAGSLVSSLNTTNVILQADATATVAAAVDASGNANAHDLAIDAPVVDLNARITLKGAGALSGTAGTVNVNGSNASIQNGIDVAAANATVNVAAGSYAEGIAVRKPLTLSGKPGAKLLVPDAAQVNGINILANNVGVSGFEIVGPATAPYVAYPWGSNISRGIAVANGVTGFAITNNDIHDIRNGILIDGRNTGTVAGNRIENTKSGISVQYTDGAGIAIAGNREGPIGNEWGINLHLNGWWDGNTIHANPYAAAPSASWQSALLAASAANGGWAVQDQAYTTSNRTRVMVAATGSASAQGSPLTPLNSVQRGVDAVVAGGTVNVDAGNYAEDVLVGAVRNLRFGGATFRSLTLGDNAGGSGIAGSATAEGTGGFAFNAPIFLLGDTTLRTAGANIAFRAGVQNTGTARRSLTLAAGAGTTLGDITMTGGGTETNPLAAFEATARNFTLDGTLWIGRYRIDSSGNIALGDRSLHALDAAVINTLAAGGDVTGTSVSHGSAVITAGGDVSANITGADVVLDAQGDVNAHIAAAGSAAVSGNAVSGAISASTASIDADAGVHVTLNTGAATIHADGNATIAGTSSSIVLDAPAGSVNGNFGKVDNAGAGLISVNGRPQGNATLSANADNSRIIPSEGVVRPTSADQGAVTSARIAAADIDIASLPPTAAGRPMVRRTPADAGYFIDLGIAVEVDLAPTNDRNDR